MKYFFILFLLTVGCSQISEPKNDLPQSKVTEQSSSVFSDKSVQETKTTTVPVEKLPHREVAQTAVDEVQLIWEIPTVPVDNYIIYYGFSKEKMDNVVKLTLADVETFEDGSYGTVHRFVLTNIPIDKTVYVSIAAMRGNSVSKAGEIIELKPEKSR